MSVRLDGASLRPCQPSHQQHRQPTINPIW